MDFPEFWDSNKWRVIKRGANLWLALHTGEEKRIGTKTVSEKIASPREKVLEINIFNRGSVGQMWFPDAVSSPRLVYSRILKNEKWVYGPKGEPISLDILWSEAVEGRRKFWGVRLELKVSENQTAAVNISKARS